MLAGAKPPAFRQSPVLQNAAGRWTDVMFQAWGHSPGPAPGLAPGLACQRNRPLMAPHRNQALAPQNCHGHVGGDRGAYHDLDMRADWGSLVQERGAYLPHWGPVANPQRAERVAWQAPEPPVRSQPGWVACLAWPVACC